MNRLLKSSLLLFAVLSFGLLPLALKAQQWTVPTAAELAMTSQPGAPGAAAVYLDYQQTTDDTLHMNSFYVRLKVLTEGGKDRANVELPYAVGMDHLSVDSITGRTIHTDGSIIPFTGKPYEKVMVKAQGYQEKEKVFTLPAVEVGSILEYRYKLHYDDYFVRSPEWYVQTDVYTVKAHYMWRPTTRIVEASGESGMQTRVAWFPFLPAGMTVQETVVRGKTMGADGENGMQFDLDVHDMAALPREAYMPPAQSLGYRVQFYYTGYTTALDFWKNDGKRWSKAHNTFIGPGPGVRAFVQQTVSPSDSADQKVKKLYDAVMTFDNTDFSRTHTDREDKAQGLKQVSTADDVLARKRGSGDQLANLFVAMARAAGLKAYVVGVANRERRLFIPAYLNLAQLDDDLAIVDIDGKETFLDPGQRFCEYKQLAWVHSQSGGMRQTESGIDLIPTPGVSAKAGHIQRVADLSLDEHGVATGTVKLTLSGNPALHWRQAALKGDDTSLNAELKEELERMLPGGMDVRVTGVENLAAYDKPLIIVYDVKGAVGSPSGKRLLITANLFQSNSKPVFPESKREQAVYLHYPSYSQDAVRFKYPASMTIESAPKEDQNVLQSAAAYSMSSKRDPGSITSFRNVTMGKVLFPVEEYPGLKAFYGKLETADQEPLVFLQQPAVVSAQPAGSE